MWQPQGFYNQYVLHTPIILSGDQAVRGLYNYPAARIAVIHGKSFFDKELFEVTFSKRDISFFERSWKDEPDIASLTGTIHELEKYRPDTIVAVGGGSVIDGSKLCRLFYEFPYYQLGETRLPGEQLRTRFIAIPTTVGSGAEASSAAVFSDIHNQKKDMIVMQEFQPDVVVYDKRYVMGGSQRLLVTSSMDAMAHILEGYVSKQENYLIDVLAEKGFLLLCTEMRKLLSGEEMDYQRLQYAGYIGGLVQNHCIVGAAHAIAHQLTEYNYSHSEAVALMLPSVIMLNACDKSVKNRYERIVQSAGFSDICTLILFFQELCGYVGIYERKDELKALLKKLAEKKTFCENIRGDKGGKGNPAEMTDEYIKQLIRSI